jgi:hypothetical protein
LTRESFSCCLAFLSRGACNYFEDLEQKVLDFSKAFQININTKISIEDLTAVLTEEWIYHSGTRFSEQEELGDLRSIYVPKSKTLLLSLI